MTEAIKQSGKRAKKKVPPGIQGLCWGGFLLGPVWALGNRLWWGAVGFLPGIHILVALAFLFKGREWAWKKAQNTSVQDFNRFQKKWTFTGLGFFAFAAAGAVFTFGFLLTVAGPRLSDFKDKIAESEARSHLIRLNRPKKLCNSSPGSSCFIIFQYQTFQDEKF